MTETDASDASIEHELATRIENPYWDIVKALPHDDLFSYRKSGFSPQSYPRSFDRPDLTRTELVRKYSWAIAAPQAIAFIVETLNGRSVVEMGAGTGYWAWMLEQCGVSVIAYDIAPPARAKNDWHSPRKTVVRHYTDEERASYRKRRQELNELTESLREATKDSDNPYPQMSLDDELPHEVATHEDVSDEPGEEYSVVLPGGPEKLALIENRTRVLFMCWPPYDTDMGYDTIKAFQGDMIIYIGEGSGGCTGNDAMWELLEAEWTEYADYWDNFVQWSGLHDYIQVYVRKAGPVVVIEGA